MKIFKIIANHLNIKSKKVIQKTIANSQELQGRMKPYTYEEIGKVDINDVTKYVPDGAKKNIIDPDVQAYYWNSYWETTPEGKKFDREWNESFKKLWETAKTNKD